MSRTKSGFDGYVARVFMFVKTDRKRFCYIDDVCIWAGSRSHMNLARVAPFRLPSEERLEGIESVGSYLVFPKKEQAVQVARAMCLPGDDAEAVPEYWVHTEKRLKLDISLSTIIAGFQPE